MLEPEGMSGRVVTAIVIKDFFRACVVQVEIKPLQKIVL
jgi:hypothetical protein